MALPSRRSTISRYTIPKWKPTKCTTMTDHSLPSYTRTSSHGKAKEAVPGWLNSADKRWFMVKINGHWYPSWWISRNRRIRNRLCWPSTKLPRSYMNSVMPYTVCSANALMAPPLWTACLAISWNSPRNSWKTSLSKRNGSTHGLNIIRPEKKFLKNISIKSKSHPISRPDMPVIAS